MLIQQWKMLPKHVAPNGIHRIVCQTQLSLLLLALFQQVYQDNKAMALLRQRRQIQLQAPRQTTSQPRTTRNALVSPLLSLNGSFRKETPPSQVQLKQKQIIRAYK